MVTLQEIKQNESIRVLIRAGNRYLDSMGYTEHGPRHVGYVSKTASYILKALGYSNAAIAGKYLLYASLACVTGAAVGLSVFLPLFPRVIAQAYALMYNLPPIKGADHGLYILLSAGLILLAKAVDGGVLCFGTMDIHVKRNAYGRQLGSFYTEQEMSGVGRVPMTFIRAPYIESVSGDAQVLAAVDGNIVAARQGNQLVSVYTNYSFFAKRRCTYLFYR